MVTLRPYRPDDAPALLALFRDTIRRVNSRDYSPAQIAAWASDDIDTVTWFGRFSGRYVPVAEEAGRPVGFAELEPSGHIDRVYVSADHQRRGIGRQLLAAVVAEARRVGLARLFTEASITARPFFVRPDRRRKGVARDALSWLRVHAWADAPRVRIDVLVGNAGAIAFWRAVGFRDYCLTMDWDRTGELRGASVLPPGDRPPGPAPDASPTASPSAAAPPT